MLKYMLHHFQSLNKLQQLFWVIFLWIWYFASSYFLENSYEASKFPVSYFEQQTSFDAIMMKQWYSVMIQEWTFQTYIQTQFIDFVFIFFVILFWYTLWYFVNSFHNPKWFIYKIWSKLTWSLPIAGFFDILENLVSFFMIYNPENFNHFLVIPYSTFAVIKFWFWTLWLWWLVFSIIILFAIQFRNLVIKK